jgi:glycosyltransferase involved in cell wall biosynthesis
MSAETNPVVSIIVPARNEEASLGACLDSLVAQTGINFEIIVVDDDSTDRTAEIAGSFARRAVDDFAATGKGTTLRQAQGRLSSRAEHHGTMNNGTAVSRALPEPEAPHDARSSTVHVGADALVRPDIYVISAPPLQNDWTGKNNAMSAGAKVAKGKWLLFTDADTVHQPGSLARAVAEAEDHGAALLSYSPEQEVRSFWEKAAMPVIFADLASAYPPQAVNDPDSPIAAANGQYLLISREAYDAVGGHSEIAKNLLEDVAMARLLKSSGRKIFFRYGGDAVRTRMYRSFAQMKEGWTKNLALLFRHPVGMAARYLIESFLLLAVVNGVIQITLFGPPHIPSQSVAFPHYPISNRYFPLFKWWLTGGMVFLFVYLLSRSIWRVVKAHFPLRLAVTSMLGPPVFAYLLLRSRHFYKRGIVDWKERAYVYSSDEIKRLKKSQVARAI